MKSNIILFIIFQTVVWALYFQSDSSDQKQNETSQKAFQVNEVIDPANGLSTTNGKKYELILRNDGFYTKIYTDQSDESGIWKINYTPPSLKLKSPKSENIYRILEATDDSVRLGLIDSQKIVHYREQKSNSSDKLFSSSPVF